MLKISNHFFCSRNSESRFLHTEYVMHKSKDTVQPYRQRTRFQVSDVPWDPECLTCLAVLARLCGSIGAGAAVVVVVLEAAVVVVVVVEDVVVSHLSRKSSFPKPPPPLR